MVKNIIVSIKTFFLSFIYDRRYSIIYKRKAESTINWDTTLEQLKKVRRHDTNARCTCSCFQQFCMQHKSDRKYSMLTEEQRDEMFKDIDLSRDINSLIRRYE